MEAFQTNRASSKRVTGLSLVCILAFSCSPLAIAAGLGHGRLQAPIERRPPPATGQAAPIERRQNGHGPRGEHLAEWMSRHSNLTPQQQQQALEREPGFQELPVPAQQRMRNRLAQLDAMNPAQRQRELARIEAMERLTLDQRAQVRGAMSQLGSLPLEQRREVARTFRALRDLPPDQRVAAFNSGRFGPPLNEPQRAALNNLLRVEPMLPPPNAVTPAPAQQPPR